MSLSALLLAALLASPHDQVGFGSAGGGVAGAAVADAPGASAAFYNPALAAERRDIEVLLGYSGASMQMKLNDDEQGIETARALSLGIIAPLSLGDWGRIGVAVYFRCRTIVNTFSLIIPMYVSPALPLGPIASE